MRGITTLKEMKKTFSSILLLLCIFVGAEAKIQVKNLSVEGRYDEPLGIDVQTPSLGWQIVATNGERDVKQTAYHILVASTPELLRQDKGDLWDAQEKTDRSIWIAYKGKPLAANQRCYWKVKVTTNKGESQWSDVSRWGVGLFGIVNWKGSWIGIQRAMPWDKIEEHSQLSARYYRNVFAKSGKEIEHATLHICGLGLYEAFINGKRVGSDVMTPAPTDFRKSQIYNSYDVTGMLNDSNCIAVTVSNGRFFTMQQDKKPYKITNFGYPTLRANLIIKYKDGKTQTIATDDKMWLVTADGPIRSSNEYDGETYDANHSFKGDWKALRFDDSKWQKAERMSILQGEMRGNTLPAMAVVDRLKVKEFIKKDDGRIIIDFGQNVAGWVNFDKLKVENGGFIIGSSDTIRIRYAEKLDTLGNLYVANLRHAYSTDTYIGGINAGAKFATHGFRFVEISLTGSKKAAELFADDDFVAEVVSDKMRHTGTFDSYNETLNKIYKAAWWGILDNYKGMPVDCPQRDERQPWLGDRTMGQWGESLLFDNMALYAKWMTDIVESQRADGVVCDVAPSYWNYYNDDITWPAALFMGNEMLYQRFGNATPIRRNYNAMRKMMMHWWNDKRKDDNLIYADKYADWCCPPESPELIHSKDPMRVTNGTLIGSCYFYRLCQTMMDFDDILIANTSDDDWIAMEREGLSKNALLADKEEFQKMREVVREAINKNFLHVKEGSSAWPGHYLYPDSVYYDNNAVTANILPLAFGIVPEEHADQLIRQVVRKHLLLPGDAPELKGSEGHIQCGVIGIQWLLRELTRRGRADVAYMLASVKSYPGWGYMVEHGATTIWELWNGDTANPAMNSGNHVMLLGDLLIWLYENIGGIQSLEPAYHKLRLAPAFEIEELPWADVSYETPYGLVQSNWRKNLEHITWDITIPANTTAEVVLPGKTETFGSGNHHIEYDVPVSQGIIADEFIYQDASFPSCHSATIAELTNGDLMCAFFGGRQEGADDVCIYTARKKLLNREYDKKGKLVKNVYEDGWQPLVKVAEGEVACYNPVLYQIPGGDLLLFYKIGRGVKNWKGYLMRSKDNGNTWIPAHQSDASSLNPDLKWGTDAYNEQFRIQSSSSSLPIDSLLGAIKNKPVMLTTADGKRKIIAPTSKEDRQWRCYMEMSEDEGKTWRLVGPIKEASNIRTIQPTILEHKDGRLQILCRTGKPKLEKGESPDQARIATSFSSDGGETWTEMQLLDVPNNNSGIDAVTLADGTFVMIYNPFGMVDGPDKPVRNPVCLAKSKDGIHWEQFVTLESSPISQYSYPSCLLGSDGTLHCIYTWRRQKIKYQQVDLAPKTVKSKSKK